MRILLVNKFYYPRGGDCMVVINTEQLLRAQGHEVAVYAMQYHENLDSDFSRYFASEVEFAGGVGAKVKALARTLGMGNITNSFTTMLRDFKPEVVHLHNIHSYLSPVLARLAHKHGCRVVWTMHDYKLLCSAYTCMRDGKTCDLCITAGKSNVLKHRCMKGSLAASAVAWLEAMKWSRKTLERYTDVFICPSEFLASMMRKAGFDANKIVTLNNFIAHPQEGEVSSQREQYYCYVGRLSSEKGIEPLLEAASHLPYQLKVAGTGPLEAELHAQYSKCDNIEFLGQLTSTQVAQLLAHAHGSVTPSQCNENNPLGVIESLCAGTPVLGTRMGGIPELIDATSGIVCDQTQLEQGIKQLMENSWQNEAIAQSARERFAPMTHYQQLMTIYSKR